MAVIVPFRGISYNPQKINDLNKVVAPPYDVISPQEQDALYQRHPQNVVRLILNKETPQDHPKDNRYTRSAALYQAWQKEGILARAPKPQFYFLQEEFSPSILPAGQTSSTSGKILRQGFIGLIRLEEYSAKVVLPHEKTQTKPRADRLALMDACQANFSQIYSLYSDEKGVMGPIYKQVFSSGPPAFDVTDSEGVRRKLWMVSDPGILKQVREIMKPKQIYIADGHHRYETALAYREGQRKKFPKGTGRETYNFTMMYFAAMEDPGVFILPTHRVVNNLDDFDARSFLDQLGSDFSVEAFDFQAGERKGRPGPAPAATRRPFGKRARPGDAGEGIEEILPPCPERRPGDKPRRTRHRPFAESPGREPSPPSHPAEAFEHRRAGPGGEQESHLLQGPGRGCRGGTIGGRADRFLPQPHPNLSGSGRVPGRRDHAFQVHLLLPQTAERAGHQSFGPP